jgi:integrase
VAYLKQRGKFWSIKYRDEHNVLLTKALGTECEQIAMRKLADFEKFGPDAIFKAGGVSGAAGVAAGTKNPLETALDGFVAHFKSDKTGVNGVKYASVLRSIFGEICPALQYRHAGSRQRVEADRPLLKAVHLQDITTARIQDYLQKILLVKDKKGRRLRGYVGKKTRNRYREVLRDFFKWALTPGRYIKTLSEDTPEFRYLLVEDIDKQLACLAEYPVLQTMVAMYICAGPRREEALWLTHDDINLDKGDHGMIDVHEKTIGGVHWKPKNGKDRQVRINKRLRGYLEQYRPAPSEHGWFFPNAAGNRWDPDEFSRHLSRVNMEMLQLPELKDYPALKIAVAMYLYSTLDWSDIVALTNKDVDLQRKNIRVKRVYTRNIPISDKLREFIEAYRTDGEEDAPFIRFVSVSKA